jgi:hypothetical protein
MLKKEIRGLKKATIMIGTAMTKYLRNIQNIPTILNTVIDCEFQKGDNTAFLVSIWDKMGMVSKVG